MKGPHQLNKSGVSHSLQEYPELKDGARSTEALWWKTTLDDDDQPSVWLEVSFLIMWKTFVTSITTKKTLKILPITSETLEMTTLIQKGARREWKWNQWCWVMEWECNVVGWLKPSSALKLMISTMSSHELALNWPSHTHTVHVVTPDWPQYCTHVLRTHLIMLIRRIFTFPLKVINHVQHV